MRSTTVLVGACLLAVLAGCGGDDEPEERTSDPAPCGRWEPMVDVGPVGSGDPDVDEVSGLVESLDQPGVLWAILDNGNPASLYAIAESGEALGTFLLPTTDRRGDPIQNVDWEDIAIEPSDRGSVLWVADTGDYPVERTTVDLYRVREPEVQPGDGTSIAPDDVERVRLAYPSGDEVRNAEAFFLDPVTGDGFIVSKGLDEGDLVSVWRASSDVLREGNGTLERVGSITGRLDREFAYGPTSADISPDGAWIVVKHRDHVLMWRQEGTVAETFASAPTPTCSSEEPGTVPDADDGESFAFDLDHGTVVGAWSTLDRREPPNPPLQHSACSGDPCLRP